MAKHKMLLAACRLFTPHMLCYQLASHTLHVCGHLHFHGQLLRKWGQWMDLNQRKDDFPMRADKCGVGGWPLVLCTRNGRRDVSFCSIEVGECLVTGLSQHLHFLTACRDSRCRDAVLRADTKPPPVLFCYPKTNGAHF